MAGNKNPFGPNVMTVQEATNQAAQRRVIRVTPTLSTDAYTNEDVFFNSTEIPNAVLRPGGSSKLVSLSVLNEDDVAHDFDIVFMQVSTDLGTINEDVGTGSLWTNALAKAAKVLGGVKIDWSTSSVDLVNNLVFTSGNLNASGKCANLPMVLQAEENATSIYMAGITRGGTPTVAADDYEIILGIEY